MSRYVIEYDYTAKVWEVWHIVDEERFWIGCYDTYAAALSATKD